MIDSAEMERRKLRPAGGAFATAVADARMQKEGVILKQNPLINKTWRNLSDKLQIMMVPADGKFFNDVLRSMNVSNHAAQAESGRSARNCPDSTEY